MKTYIKIISITLAPSIGLSTILIDEDFNGSTTPAGWVAHTYTGGSHTDPGSPQGDAFRYPNAGTDGYLQLTQDSAFQRTTMIYTGNTLNTKNSFSFTADIQITGAPAGADGLSFFWVSKKSIDQIIATDASVNSIEDISGGISEWQGAPHGIDPTKSVGYYQGIEGYSFEFDHYQNTVERSSEYNHLVRISDWDHGGSVAAADRQFDDNFYYNDGWTRVHFDFDTATSTFSYYLESLNPAIAPELKFTTETTFTIDQLDAVTGETGWYEGFDEAYFGIGAATGFTTAQHLADNLVVAYPENFSAVPEPTNEILMGFLMIAALSIHSRQ